MRLIDAEALYEQIAKKEELARQRVLDTPSRMPNGDFNPSAMRYATQLDERTQMKFMIADAPTIDTEPHWIPCSERLPEDDREVLAVSDGCVLIANWQGEWIKYIELEDDYTILEPVNINVQYWMELPKPPDVEE